MTRWVLQFWSGLGFLILGWIGRIHHGSAKPDDGFMAHPLAAPEAGAAVEVVGWLGVLSLVLIAMGLFFVGYTVNHGFKTGAIQAGVSQVLPKRKKPEPEEDESAED